MPGDFLSSVKNITLEGTNLVAHCIMKDGGLNQTSIDLNDWVANNEGQLNWAAGGNFSATCENIHLEDGGATLVCNAIQTGGAKVEASLDLNARIANIDGDLVVE